jgi:hypothetical protein
LTIIKNIVYLFNNESGQATISGGLLLALPVKIADPQQRRRDPDGAVKKAIRPDRRSTAGDGQGC